MRPAITTRLFAPALEDELEPNVAEIKTLLLGLIRANPNFGQAELIAIFQKIWNEKKFIYLADFMYYCQTHPTPYNQIFFALIIHPCLEDFWERKIINNPEITSQFPPYVQHNFEFKDAYPANQGIYRNKVHYLLSLLTGMRFYSLAQTCSMALTSFRLSRDALNRGDYSTAYEILNQHHERAHPSNDEHKPMGELKEISIGNGAPSLLTLYFAYLEAELGHLNRVHYSLRMSRKNDPQLTGIVNFLELAYYENSIAFDPHQKKLIASVDGYITDDRITTTSSFLLLAFEFYQYGCPELGDFYHQQAKGHIQNADIIKQLNTHSCLAKALGLLNSNLSNVSGVEFRNHVIGCLTLYYTQIVDSSEKFKTALLIAKLYKKNIDYYSQLILSFSENPPKNLDDSIDPDWEIFKEESEVGEREWLEKARVNSNPEVNVLRKYSSLRLDKITTDLNLSPADPLKVYLVPTRARRWSYCNYYHKAYQLSKKGHLEIAAEYLHRMQDYAEEYDLLDNIKFAIIIIHLKILEKLFASTPELVPQQELVYLSIIKNLTLIYEYLPKGYCIARLIHDIYIHKLNDPEAASRWLTQAERDKAEAFQSLNQFNLNPDHFSLEPEHKLLTDPKHSLNFLNLLDMLETIGLHFYQRPDATTLHTAMHAIPDKGVNELSLQLTLAFSFYLEGNLEAGDRCYAASKRKIFDRLTIKQLENDRLLARAIGLIQSTETASSEDKLEAITQAIDLLDSYYKVISLEEQTKIARLIVRLYEEKISHFLQALQKLGLNNNQAAQAHRAQLILILKKTHTDKDRWSQHIGSAAPQSGQTSLLALAESLIMPGIAEPLHSLLTHARDLIHRSMTASLENKLEAIAQTIGLLDSCHKKISPRDQIKIARLIAQLYEYKIAYLIQALQELDLSNSQATNELLEARQTQLIINLEIAYADKDYWSEQISSATHQPKTSSHSLTESLIKLGIETPKPLHRLPNTDVKFVHELEGRALFYKAYYLSRHLDQPEKAMAYLKLLESLPINTQADYHRIAYAIIITRLQILQKLSQSPTMDPLHLNRSEQAYSYRSIVQELHFLYKKMPKGYAIALLIQRIYSEKLNDRDNASLWNKNAARDQNELIHELNSLGTKAELQLLLETPAPSFNDLITTCNNLSLRYYSTNSLAHAKAYLIAQFENVEPTLAATLQKAMNAGIQFGDFGSIDFAACKTAQAIVDLDEPRDPFPHELITQLLTLSKLAIRYHGAVGYMLRAEACMQVRDCITRYLQARSPQLLAINSKSVLELPSSIDLERDLMVSPRKSHSTEPLKSASYPEEELAFSLDEVHLSPADATGFHTLAVSNFTIAEILFKLSKDRGATHNAFRGIKQPYNALNLKYLGCKSAKAFQARYHESSPFLSETQIANIKNHTARRVKAALDAAQEEKLHSSFARGR